MRVAWLTLAFLVLPVAGASPFLQDPEGDVHLIVADTAGPATASHASIDLTSLEVVEEKDALAFVVHLADVGEGSQDTSPDGSACFLFLRHNGRDFLLVARRFTPALGGTPFAQVYARDDPATDWEQHPEADLDTSLDAAADTLTYRIARPDLADALGAAPYPGRLLESVRVVCDSASLHTSIVGGDLPVPAGATDAMPDDAASAASYAIVVGAAQTGHAQLTSPEPFRSSNGEATTFVYNVTLHNLGDAEDTFTLSTRDVPTTMKVAGASSSLTVPARGSVALQVKATVPFLHEHGTAASFLLEATSDHDDASVGRIELGVRYLTVPQPAGHHDRLYVHTYATGSPTAPVEERVPGVVGTDGYLNTLENDEGDSGQPVAFSGQSSLVGNDGWDFAVALHPSLLMGLDVDLARTGEAVLSIGSRTPVTTATLSAKVMVYGLGGSTEVAHMDAAPIDSAAQDTYTFRGVLVPNQEADRIPYIKGQNLYLELHFTNTDPNGVLGADPPYLLTGSMVQLPLLEYHDEVPADETPLDDDLAQGAAPDAPGKESPSLSLAAVLVGLAVLVGRRRH